MTKNDIHIGMIGVGMMGHGIALNVIGKGAYPLTFLDHPGNQPVDDLLATGARRADSAADIARACDIVILCVTGTPQVEEVIFRPGGLPPSMKGMVFA
jgi:3-hydroxyisobutyrate dehydrogenase